MTVVEIMAASSSNNIGLGEVLQGILKGLLRMPALERLDLQHNNLLNAGCDVVAALMHGNSQLKYVFTIDAGKSTVL